MDFLLHTYVNIHSYGHEVFEEGQMLRQVRSCEETSALAQTPVDRS
jgi:hypothetical protein